MQCAGDDIEVLVVGGCATEVANMNAAVTLERMLYLAVIYLLRNSQLLSVQEVGDDLNRNIGKFFDILCKMRVGGNGGVADAHYRTESASFCKPCDPGLG